MSFLTNLTFIPEWTIFVQFAIATAILSITPGPDMTLFVGRALSEGKAAGFACMAGANTGIVIHTTMVALGLSARRFRRKRTVVKSTRWFRTGRQGLASICSTRRSFCST